MGEVLVGTAGWTDRGLTETGWYPPGVHDADRLTSYAERFPLVEVNTSYYAIPRPEVAQGWVDRTPEDFTFNVKAFSGLTKHTVRSSFLPPDLRPGTEWVRLRDLTPDTVDELWARFLLAVEPIRAAGKLGLLLFQFPPWFRPGEAARQYLLECKQRCAPTRICVELRHSSWLNHVNGPETLAFLCEHDLPYVSVDMPQGHDDSMPPLLVATSDIAVLRLHGHSPQWTSKDIEQRFRYSYSDRELAAWARRVRELDEPAHVVFNNCYRDEGHRNAERFQELL
ncbi:DUF72 domain-containing protein [Allokutzneria albata]|uniref:Uncharacterized conserved protein YecE, DUF72 family n=1 Tax=Allokutzneria albata TaxID=211114 RepID=A0A1H0DQ49_ALLAB|nr:DUF72 domain-containing protein [Allokutzneria albata]SDN72189.1 Uncharacterized conserved protein YecE, DUF72 family [Allokutzneria albata]